MSLQNALCRRQMPRLRIARPEARQIVLAWLTFNWGIRKLEARFHYAPSTIARLLKYWRRHQALPHDARVRRRDAVPEPHGEAADSAERDEIKPHQRDSPREAHFS